MTEPPTEETIESLAALCAAAPHDIARRLALVRALLAAGRAADAVIPAEQACALFPGSVEAADLRTQVVQALETGDPALVRLELQAALDPDNAASRLALGDAYAALDRPHDAERQFKALLSLGRTAEAHTRLAALYLSVAMPEAARHHALAALACDGDDALDDALFAMAHQTLAAVCEAGGETAAAAAHLDLAYGRQSLFRQPAVGCPFTTLILVTRDTGNIPYRSLLPPQSFDCALWYMEHADLGQLAELPPHAVVLNAIGDPDVAQASRAIVDAVTAASSRPVLNAPERVRATFRHRLGETLTGIDGVLAPETARVSADRIAIEGLAAAIAAEGLAAPVIVRPAGSHGGLGLTLCGTDAALETLAPPPGQDLYVSRFVDYRSPDGFFRKYRAILIGGRPFPYHLAIGRHWMVHHQSADMAHDPGRIEEELAFLRDPTAAIGARAMAAVAAIGERLGLDYGGVDFSLTADGRVLVFEANATMLTHLEREDGPFAAKNPFIRPIIEAFQARLLSLVTAGA
jgi:tetratricopeptide (TPR) repeat protein